MNKIIIVLSILFFSCTGPGSKTTEDLEQGENHNEHQKKDAAGMVAIQSLQLNNGQKWKADEPTGNNVAAIIKTVNDSTLAGKENVLKLTTQLQSGLDELVKQCRMKGPDHDALHAWLKSVMQDVKDLRNVNQNGEYDVAYAQLKMDVESFYVFFE